MHAMLRRTADLFALLGGVVLALIVAVTTTNTGAFMLDRLTGLVGVDVPGLPGYEDFVTLAISGAALMFFPYCQVNRGHVSVELFMDKMPRTVREVSDKAWLVLTAGMALFLAYWMAFGLLEARDDGAVTSVLGWSVWPFYLPGILSMALWAAVAFAQIFGELRDA